MRRFFARLLAIILSVSVFVVGAALLVQIEPLGTGGWIFMGLAVLALIGGPVLIYHAIMGQVGGPGLINEGEGAGLAMGAAIDVSRRKSTDGDVDSDGFDFD